MCRMQSPRCCVLRAGLKLPSRRDADELPTQARLLFSVCVGTDAMELSRDGEHSIAHLAHLLRNNQASWRGLPRAPSGMKSTTSKSRVRCLRT